MDTVPGVDRSPTSHPLATVLRGAFAIVILSALTVDSWAGERVVSRPSGALALIALLGIAWAGRPTTTATSVVALSASLLSLLATANAPQDGLPFAFFTEFAVLPVLLGAVLFSRLSWRWPLAALVVGAAESIALRAEPGPIRWIVATSMLVLLGAATSAVVYIRLRDNEHRTSVETARQNERLELARELHDVVGHHVTGIVVLAQANRFAAAAGNATGAGAPEIERTLADIEAAGLETLSSVRRLVGLLRADPTISSGPTLADLERLVDELRLTHPQAELVLDPTIQSDWVPTDLATTVLRLVQEATTNVRKHGDPAGRVRFRLERSGTSVDLAVENEAVHLAVGSGYGLIGMRERVEALGGTFSAGPDGAGRWALRSTLPLTAMDRP